jgi:L-ascorbate metabolism protein UlaG (beta-lactamase superfamily)
VKHLELTHLGGPTVLAEVDGVRILTDPTFDPPGQRYSFGWGTSSTKLTGPAVPTAELGRIDAVLLTHDHHADNLDDAGRAFLATVPVVITTTAGATRLGGGAVGLRPWDQVDLEGTGLTVTATPCRHGPPLSRPIAGPVIGFAVAAGSAPALWISGDTVLYRGVRSVAERLDIDVAVLHLGAVRFPVTGPLRYSMTIDDALELCDLVEPRVAVPVHFDGWSHFSQQSDAVRRRLAAGTDHRVERFRLLEPGVATDLSPVPAGPEPGPGVT